jgi:5-methylcytosine-specific restriction endonuclease McrA
VLRREANKTTAANKGDGKDLDHIKPLSKGGANTLANTRLVSKKANRSFSRNANGSLKSQTSKAERHKQ